MELFKEERSSRGRTLKRPRAVYEPPSDFEDTDGEGEDVEEEEEEEEEEDEDTDLSGFICDDDDVDSDGSYDPDEEDEAEDTEEEEQDPMVVTRDNMIDRMTKFGESLEDSTDEAEVLVNMIAAGYKFPFLKEKYQIKLYPYYKRRERPPLGLVKEAFSL